MIQKPLVAVLLFALPALACVPSKAVDPGAGRLEDAAAPASEAGGASIPSPEATSPDAPGDPYGSVESLVTRPAGSPYDLRVDPDGVTYCDRRGARKLTNAPGGDVPWTRTCTKDTAGETFHCDDHLTLSRPRGLDGSDYVLEFSSDQDYACMGLANGLVACANDGPTVVVGTVGTSDGVRLWNADNDEVDVLDAHDAIDVAIGPSWVAWSGEHAVHAKRRLAGDAGSVPSRHAVPQPVAYSRYSDDGVDVDVPTFFRRGCRPQEGSMGWVWAHHASFYAATRPLEAPDASTPPCEAQFPDAGAHWVRQVSATGCFGTGVSDGAIHWLRERIVCGQRQSLEFEYEESLKSGFDAVVTHVDRSWRLPVGDGGSCPPSRDR